MTKKLDNLNFENEILEHKGTALVDFYADWCGPCKMIAPIIEEIAAQMPDVTVGKINVDESGDLAARYGVMSIPTLVIFKDGIEVNRIVGLQPKANILSML